ncbi:MAG: cofactor-independent phosphoglycerate mutase [Nitrospirota bacterium]
MKHVIIVGDGMSDEPIPELGGRTPLQAAKTPHMDELARRGELGLVHTTPDGYPPGSDVTQMGILGYDPKKYYTGRSPLEAASIGVHLGKDDVAFRCNLVTLSHHKSVTGIHRFNGRVVMEDYSAGHISTDEARELITDLNDQIGSESFQFYSGVSYRHLLVWIGGKTLVQCTPPHDISGRAVSEHLPKGDGNELLREIMEAALQVLADHPLNADRRKEGKLPANSIWLWGHGKAPTMPKFKDRFGLSGAMIAAVDLMKGLGIYAGFELIDVPGATGFLDTNYRGKADYALQALKRHDLVYVHVEAPDEASHMGNLEEKVKAIEALDEKVVGPIHEGMEAFGEHKILILPDHPNPVRLKTHTSGPVPYLLYQHGSKTGSGRGYNEPDAQAAGVVIHDGYRLIERFVQPAR